MNRDQTLALLERLRVAQLRLAAAALVVMMCVTVIDVFLRYVFNSPIRSSYDMVEAMMVLFVFNGMSTAFLQRRNIAIDLVDSFVGRRVVGALIRLSDVSDRRCAGAVHLRDAHAGAAILWLWRTQARIGACRSISNGWRP